MTNSLPQRAEALRGEARRSLLAIRDQLTVAVNSGESTKPYIELRDTKIREVVGILPTSEIADLTGVTRQRIQQITQQIARDGVAAFHSRFTPEAMQENREAVINDAVQSLEDTRQAELELTEMTKQYRENSTPDNLAILMRVATNIVRAQALPISRITEITRWSKADLTRLAYGGIETARIPEADV